MQTLQGIFFETWFILNKSAVFILFGLFLAGIIKTFIPVGFVERHLGNKNITSIIKSSLMGIPLPLCSCGVIPVSIGLRKQGASKGATTAFLIATPETGVDSIAITYALLDPLMTVIRPLAAFVTACIAGMIVNLLPDNTAEPNIFINNVCSCDKESSDIQNINTDTQLYKRMRNGFSFTFNDLLSDIGMLLLAGFFIAGIIGYLVPDGFIENNLGAGLLPILIMLAVGIPVYVCATASTPIVAALAVKGLSPGAAIVFLLAGPATNAASITVIANLLGKRVAGVYVLTISIIAVLIGCFVNSLYGFLSLDISQWVSKSHTMEINVFTRIISILLIALILRARFRPQVSKKVR